MQNCYQKRIHGTFLVLLLSIWLEFFSFHSAAAEAFSIPPASVYLFAQSSSPSCFGNCLPGQNGYYLGPYSAIQNIGEVSSIGDGAVVTASAGAGLDPNVSVNAIVSNLGLFYNDTSAQAKLDYYFVIMSNDGLSHFVTVRVSGSMSILGSDNGYLFDGSAYETIGAASGGGGNYYIGNTIQLSTDPNPPIITKGIPVPNWSIGQPTFENYGNYGGNLINIYNVDVQLYTNTIYGIELGASFQSFGTAGNTISQDNVEITNDPTVKISSATPNSNDYSIVFGPGVISPTSVPEPSNWFFAILGIGVVGLALRLREQAYLKPTARI